MDLNSQLIYIILNTILLAALAELFALQNIFHNRLVAHLGVRRNTGQ